MGVITGELRSKIDRVWDAFWFAVQGLHPDEMHTVVGEHVFPFLRQGLSGDTVLSVHQPRRTPVDYCW